MTQHWKGEATDGVLVFVGPRVYHTCYYAPKLNNIDRSVFCRCRCPALRIHPGPQAKFSGHFRILSREYFPGSC